MKKNSILKINQPRDMFHLQWHVTERCNLRCSHCYMDENLIKDEMGLGTVKDILYQYLDLVREWRMPRSKNRISFTGGEPFVRSDLFDILEECNKNHDMLQYGLLSNGFFLSDENVSRLRSLRVDYVQVSIEGVEKNNDSIRGKGAFKKAVEGIKRVVDAGIGASISMTVHRKNLNDVAEMISLARRLKVGVIGIRRLVPCGHGKGMRDLMLTPAETKEVMCYIARTALQTRDVYITCGCEDGIVSQNMHYSPIGCLAGFHSLTILPNGNVYPCRRLPVLAGRLKEESLKDIFCKSDLLNEIRNVNNNNTECLVCPFFNECLGGAKCISYAYWGKLGGGDPQCWRRFDKLPAVDTRWAIPEKERRTITYF
ncbi:MAG: radical SAM protein [Candidatus Omnitrophota bacterium]